MLKFVVELLAVLMPKRQASGQVHNMRACMHWMPKHSHTFSLSLKPMKLLFCDSGMCMSTGVYARSLSHSNYCHGKNTS
jgi:hypothetical protein